VTDEADDMTLCPSAPATPEAMLIGLVVESGRVANLATPLTIDSAFIDAAQSQGPPEQRFRFASPCQERRCGHWTGHECGLIGQLYNFAIEEGEELADGALPRCGIRAQCRWWHQRGRDACAVCPLVVTDTRSFIGGEGQAGSR
jgi:hypothetical protein